MWCLFTAKIRKKIVTTSHKLIVNYLNSVIRIFIDKFYLENMHCKIHTGSGKIQFNPTIASGYSVYIFQVDLYPKIVLYLEIMDQHLGFCSRITA